VDVTDLRDLTAAVRAAEPEPVPWRDLAAYIGASVARDPAKPFVTWYDDESGERVELSYATFANWVWKTANFLRDGLGVQPGDRVVSMLRTHWQTLAVWFGAWAAGAVVVPLQPGTVERYDGHGASAAFVQEDLLPMVAGSGARFGDVVGLSLRPMAGRLTTAPRGVTDYAEEVPAYGDQLGSGERALLDDEAIPGRSGTRLLAGARAAAAQLRLGGGDRMLCTLPVTEPELITAVVLAAFDAGAGLVLCRSTDPAGLWRRVADERVTVVVIDSRTLDAAGEPSGVPELRSVVRLAIGPGETPQTQAGR
jgi:uncharacterized protein (TIGR03089 family)